MDHCNQEWSGKSHFRVEISRWLPFWLAGGHHLQKRRPRSLRVSRPKTVWRRASSNCLKCSTLVYDLIGRAASQPANKQTVWITLNYYNHIYDNNIISKKDKGWWYDDRTNYIFHYICVYWFLWTQAYGGSWRQTFWRQALLGKRLTRKWYVPQYTAGGDRGPSCLITWFLQATTTRKLNSE